MITDLLDVSNPYEVQLKAFEILGPNAYVYKSSRKTKKYMIQNPRGQWIHFGEMGMTDYTKHKDPERLRKFKSRNHKWADAEPYSPAFLSYYLLW